MVTGNYLQQFCKDQALLGAVQPKAGAGVAVIQNFQKLLEGENAVKQLGFDDLPKQFKKFEFTPNGKFLLVQGESVAMYSALTLKKKHSVESVRSVAFAAAFKTDEFTVADELNSEEFQKYYAAYASNVEQQCVFA